MKRLLALLFVSCITILIGTSCSMKWADDILPTDKAKDIQLTAYAEEIGFSLITPEKDLFETETVVDIQGTVEEMDASDWQHIWIEVKAEEPMELEHDLFNYYVAVENGEFAKEIRLHQGVGEYEVNIFAPSNDVNEEDMYYDVAAFTVVNQDDEVRQEIAYTLYGVQEGIILTEPILGVENSETGSVLVEGTVPNEHKGDMVIFQIEQGARSEQVIAPLKDNKFSTEIPLYFGKEQHTIRVQTFNEQEDVYYEAATFYVNNEVDVEFTEVTKHTEYIDRGLTINEPNSNKKAVLQSKEYPITGEVDPSAPDADKIDYIIVTVIHNEEDSEAVYIIPVVDYQFDGMAYFRFGPGDYTVVINVPEMEQKDQSSYFYRSVMSVNHIVENIEDERGLLPSRGIESDNETIIKHAKEITKDIESEREKAKAIYKFVAQHVAYDVQKAENNVFTLEDSALSTLESGQGICQDYAFLTIALLRAIEMDAHYVSGDAGERHAWVEVKVDGEWLEMDPTWGAGYVANGEFQFHYTEDYFDPDSDFLAETHTRDEIMY